MDKNALATSLRLLADKVESGAFEGSAVPDAASLPPQAYAPGYGPQPGEDPVSFAARVAARSRNLARENEERGNRSYTGPVKVWLLTPHDAQYFDSVADDYKLKTGNDLLRDGIIEGSEASLLEFRNFATAMRNRYDLSDYTSDLKTIVEGRLTGR